VVALAGVAAFAAWQMDSIQRGWIYVIELTAGVAPVWLLRWYGQRHRHPHHRADVAPDGTAARRWLGWGMGLTFVYGSLLGIGYLVTGRPGSGVLLLALAAAGATGALAMTRSTVSGSSSVP